MEFNKEKFINDLILYRAQKMRWTLKKSAAHAGISLPTLSRMERGSVPDLLNFAKACKWMRQDMAIYFNPI